MSKAKVGLAIALGLAIGSYMAFRGAGGRQHMLPGGASARSQPQLAGSEKSRPAEFRFSKRPARLGADEGTAPETIEEAKRQLTELLKEPRNARSYPPPELAKVLGKFEGRYREAMPILIEAAGREDYETRAWAISGIQQILHRAAQAPIQDDYLEFLEMARPILSKVLRSASESDLLRMMAISTYLPSFGGGPLSDGAVDDLQAVLRMNDSKSNGFAFTAADLLNVYFAQHAGEADRFRSLMESGLQDKNRGTRFLSAYALSQWPGEKPAGLKDIFLREIRERSTHSYRAADGLGQLGPSGIDAVPELVSYAQATADWAEGYRKNAIQAAIKLDPNLAKDYPEAAAQLREETAAKERAAQGNYQTTGMQITAADFEDPEKVKNLRKFMTELIQQHAASEQMREGVIQNLERWKAGASEKQLAGINSVIASVSAAEPSREAQESPPPQIIFANLVLDARVLLLDQKTDDRAVEAVLEKFQAEAQSKVSAALYQQFSDELTKIDPAFQKIWKDQIYKNYPWLDRVFKKKD